MFSSVKLSEPNNKFSIEITVYGVILIINCILAFVYSNIVEHHICQKSQYNDHRKVRILQPLKFCFALFCFVLFCFMFVCFLFFVFFLWGRGLRFLLLLLLIVCRHMLSVNLKDAKNNSDPAVLNMNCFGE